MAFVEGECLRLDDIELVLLLPSSITIVEMLIQFQAKKETQGNVGAFPSRPSLICWEQRITL